MCLKEANTPERKDTQMPELPNIPLHYKEGGYGASELAQIADADDDNTSNENRVILIYAACSDPVHSPCNTLGHDKPSHYFDERCCKKEGSAAIFFDAVKIFFIKVRYHCFVPHVLYFFKFLVVYTVSHHIVFSA